MIGDPYLLLADLAGSGIFRAWTFMLLHSLWLGLLLHMAAVFLLRYSKRMSAAVIYNLLLFLFFIFLVVCGCILVLQLRTAPIGLMVGSPLTSVAVSAFSWWPLLTWAWLIAFLVRSGRFGWDLTSNYRLARSARGETNPYWQHRLDELAMLLGIRGGVRLLESSTIQVPAIICMLKPVILVPLGVLASLPADQLEAVLLHELAHIRRKDYLVNLIQVMMEAIFFFNPGLRWLSAQLRIQREHCCDDIALDHVDKLTFVQALVSFQEHFLYRRAFPLAFTGQKDRLLARVGRITGRPIASSPRGGLYLLVYLFPVLLMGWFSLSDAKFPLQQELAISKLSGSRHPMKRGMIVTRDQSLGPHTQRIARRKSSPGALFVVQHTHAVSSQMYQKDSISSISSAPLAVTATPEVAQSEYAKEMQAYGERMVLYKKELQAYNEEMVQYKKTLQANNERIRQYLNDTAVKPPD